MTADAARCEMARMDVRELVRRLNGHLGATLVAALSGARDSKVPYRWAEPDGPRPAAESEERLRAAYSIWVMLSDAEPADVARSWFVGANPLLDGVAPLMVLREGGSGKASRAAEAFVSGSWSS